MTEKSLTAQILDAMQGVVDAVMPKEKAVKVEVPPLTEEQLNEKVALKNKLQHGVYYVVFEKVDGTIATMECTLDPRHLPVGLGVAHSKPRAEAEHLLYVYAVDRAGWRSFHVTKVKNVYRKPEAS